MSKRDKYSDPYPEKHDVALDPTVPFAEPIDELEAKGHQFQEASQVGQIRVGDLPNIPQTIPTAIGRRGRISYFPLWMSLIENYRTFVHPVNRLPDNAYLRRVGTRAQTFITANQSDLEKYIEGIKDKLRTDIRDDVRERRVSRASGRQGRSLRSRLTTASAASAGAVTAFTASFKIIVLLHVVYPMLPIFCHILHYFLLGYSNTIDYTNPNYNEIMWGRQDVDPLDKVYTQENIQNLFAVYFGAIKDTDAGRYLTYLNKSCSKNMATNPAEFAGNPPYTPYTDKLYHAIQGHYTFLPEFFNRYSAFFADKIKYLVNRSGHFARKYGSNISFQNFLYFTLPLGDETESVLTEFAESFFQFLYQEFEIPGGFLTYEDFVRANGNEYNPLQKISILQEDASKRYVSHGQAERNFDAYFRSHWNPKYNKAINEYHRYYISFGEFNRQRGTKPPVFNPEEQRVIEEIYKPLYARKALVEQQYKELEEIAGNYADKYIQPLYVMGDRSGYSDSKSRVSERQGLITEHRFETYCRHVGYQFFQALQQTQPNLPNTFIPIDVIDRFLYNQTFSPQPDPPLKFKMYDYITNVAFMDYLKIHPELQRAEENEGERTIIFHMEDDDIYTELRQTDPNMSNIAGTVGGYRHVIDW